MLILSSQLFKVFSHRTVAFRIYIFERKLVQFLAQILHAHPASERGINFHCLGRDAFTLVRFHMIKRAHIVQAISKLDQ